jgi:hypothetical protein
MSNPSVSPAEAWRLSALATTVSRELRQRHGTQKFYAADEVEAVCNACKVPHDSRQYAVAMFVAPEQAQGFLQRLGSSKTTAELRKFMAQAVFFYYLPGTSYDSDSVVFHEAGEAGGATSGTFVGSADSGSDGGGDGGGGDGGSD